MKKSLQLFSVIFMASFVIGCANSQLQTDVDELKAQMKAVSAEASEAKQRSKSAEATAKNAEQKASQAEQNAADANSKLDRMFKKSMMK
ncbi:MAG: hypothetical protein KZQ83_04200 [gamma proteobacterium symbiont of Taylorina sp.]|nr:hypothetical protein [gamma proteobacterium symbiont of Taylorina sp.]